MTTTPRTKAAIYIKEAAGYPDAENSKELQLHHCEEFCKAHDLDIVARYHDPIGVRQRLRLDDGRGYPRRTALRLHRRLQAPQLLMVPGRDRPVPGPAQRQRRHPRLHHGKTTMIHPNQGNIRQEQDPDEEEAGTTDAVANAHPQGDGVNTP